MEAIEIDTSYHTYIQKKKTHLCEMESAEIDTSHICLQIKKKTTKCP